MTARANTPQSIAIMEKRSDRTPKTKTKRGENAGGAIAVARTGKNTSNYAVAETIDPSKPLTDKQKAFVKLWAEGESITSASVRAGYNDGGTVGYRLTKMPNVLALYHEIKAKYEAAGDMTRKKVMDMLLESYEMAKLMAEPSTMVAAAREVGKMCGYYAPVESRIKLDISGNVVVEKLNALTDEELVQLIAKGNASA